MTDFSPLSIEAVSKSYTNRRVLDALSFTLQPGEIFGLIGLNGAGKTTLIKIILDLVTADSGQASLFGIDCRDVRARTRLSYLPEKFQPSRYLKGFEYLRLALSYYGKSLDDAMAVSAAEALALDPRALAQRVGSYSKGMGQKLGLLGAFMVEPDLLLLDEPMSGLDPSARIRLKAMLLQARAAGKTVFFSSHILSDIDEICDRIGIIHDGILHFVGTPAAFKAKMGEASLEKCFLHLIEPPAQAA